jgi:hypothetical protein
VQWFTFLTSIVLVPGIGTISPELWPFASQEWLSTLPGAGAGARIIAYEYASPFKGTKHTWESMLMQGYDLLQQLSDARSQSRPDLVSSTVCVHLIQTFVTNADVPYLDPQ